MSNSIEEYVLGSNFNPETCEFDEALLDFEDGTTSEVDIFLPRETITTAQRLERFPEMHHIPARRYKRLSSEVSNNGTTKFIKVYDPFKKSEAIADKTVVSCTECKSCFKSKSTMEKHKVLHSKENQEIRLPTFICPFEDCTVHCDCQDTLNLHVKNSHDRPDICYEELQFPDWAAFESWQEDHEHTTSSRFVHFSGRATPYGKNIRLSCFFTRSSTHNTSFAASSTTENRVRHSKKLHRACTAHMAVRQCYGRVHVRACLTHCGHEAPMNMYKLPLSKRIKNEIATALMKGHSEEEILASYAETCSSSDRRYYVRLYEIRNIFQKLVQSQEKIKTPLSQIKDIEEEVPLIFEEFPPTRVKRKESDEIPSIFGEFPSTSVKSNQEGEFPIIFDEFAPIAVKEEEVVTDY